MCSENNAAICKIRLPHSNGVIHSNYGSDKPTGHLGSFLEKKTENQIQLEINTVNKEWITVSCKRSRGYAFDTFSFSINEFGLPFVVGEIYDPLEYFVPRTLTLNQTNNRANFNN